MQVLLVGLALAMTLGSLALEHRLVDAHLSVVETNRIWAARLAAYSRLGTLAAETNALGNDILVRRHLDAARTNLERNMRKFLAALEVERERLSDLPNPEIRALVGTALAQLEAHMVRHAAGSRSVLSYLEDGHEALAVREMAAIDLTYYELSRALDLMQRAVRSAQHEQLVEQAIAAQELRHSLGVGAVAAIVVILGVGSLGLSERRELARRTRDITQHAALIESVFWQVADGIVMTDDHGIIELVNPAVSALFGYTRAELIGRNVSMLMAEPQRSEHDSHLASYRATGIARIIGVGREVMARHKDGSVSPFHLNVARVDVGGRLLFTGILRDISDQVESQRALRDAKELAESATRAKSRFLATMSHEIRTPMNGVMGMTELLLHTELNPGQVEYARSALASAQALVGLIDDILDLSKIEAGRLELEELEFELVTQLEESVEMFVGAARSRKLVFDSVLDPRLPFTVYGDPSRLRQVLVNLIGNAQKFTQEGAVVVRARILSADPVEQLEVEVSDTGPGISPERHTAIFEPFTQADSSTTRHFGGSGLGLTICRELVGRMHGEMGVDSELGQGARFWLRLPLREADCQRSDPSAAPLRGVRAHVLGLAGSARDAAISCLQAVGAEVSSSEETALCADVEADLICVCGGWDAMEPPDLRHLPSGCARLFLAPDLPAGTTTSLLERGFDAYARTPLRRQSLANLALAALSQRAAHRTGPHALLTEASVRSIASESRSVGESEHRVVEEPADEVGLKPGLRVLVAEDNPTNQLIVQHMLELLGANVEVAATGVEALRHLSEAEFDLVLMDCQMPQLDGYETTRRLRAGAGENRDIPVIALTASAIAGDRERCLESGMDDHLTKPIGMAELQAGIERWADGRHRRGDDSA